MSGAALEPLLPSSEIGIWSGCLWLPSGPLHPALQGRERAGMPGLVPRPKLFRASHTALQDPDQSPGQALRLELLEAGTHSCVLAVRLSGRGQERNLGGAAFVWRTTHPEPRSTDAFLEAEAWPHWMARCWGCGPHRGPGGVSGRGPYCHSALQSALPEAPRAPRLCPCVGSHHSARPLAPKCGTPGELSLPFLVCSCSVKLQQGREG